VNCTEVGVLKDVDDVVLRGVLKGVEGLARPAAEQQRTLRSTIGSLNYWHNRHNDRGDRKQIVLGAPVTIAANPESLI
jgi:hypothetical protein